MGEAFDLACKLDKGQAVVVRDIIARRIVEVAKKGERDPVRLCEAALHTLIGIPTAQYTKAPAR